MALAIGLTSASHLEEVWVVLEDLGRTRFLRSSVSCSDSQDPSLHWKWVSSTTLLCYGQMVAHATENILPWVDNIASRMVYYFSSSRYDSVLKTSFLSAAVMLVAAIAQKPGAQSYKFTQIPELIQCLLCVLQREPNFLVNLLREKIITVIVGLSHLRPHLKPTVKTRILQTCLGSLYTLPPMEQLERSLPPLEPAPDVKTLYRKTVKALDLLLQSFIQENESMDEIYFLLQHMETWLKSERSHERQRATQSISVLLQYTLDYLNLTRLQMTQVVG
ncbi:maestro heat-like repeat family member 5 [Dasypus novemcinctus]|uniref:maestro heat-like repeat family member 5 n=1 Tax=Dasypus novemcinctus TaxID=9361 RepID=UPI0039C9C6C3